MTREVWNNLPGWRLTSFTTSPRYGQPADSVTTFAGAAAPANIAGNFASRVRAYVTPPVTGTYTFWVSSDDDSELRLSSTGWTTDMVAIASIVGWVNPQAWDTKTTQKSAPIQLEAGKRYFLEALHKDGGGTNHLSIAWQTPGGTRQLIPASALESYAADPNDQDNDGLRDDWELAYGFSLSDNGTANPSQHPQADPDHDGYSNWEESQYNTHPSVRGGVPGSLLLENWSGIPGSRVEDLMYHPRIAAAPDTSEFIFAAQTPVDRADNFGARMRGYVIAPSTGEYTFYLSGDDDCQLWLSPSGSQFAKQKVAWLDGATSVGQWTRDATQQSPVFTLQAGQRVYIEAIQKEGSGGDHLEIGWKTPESGSVTVIPGTVLESYAYDVNDADGDNMPDDWEALHGLNPSVNDAAADPDGDAVPNHLEAFLPSDPQVKSTIPGAMLHELWLDVPGYQVADFVGSSKFRQQPDSISLITSAQTASLPHDEFGSRLRGYLTAPATGTYTFWVLGDDQTELWLSSSDSKFDKRLLVRPTLNTYDFDTDLSQKSRQVPLVAGQKYYIEVLHKDYYGGDLCKIAWTRPGSSREVISGTYLESFAPVANDQDDDDLPDDWESANGLSPHDNGRINPANGAQGDLDGDGLTNAEEHAHGTRADLGDTDGDGVSDRDEIKLLETQALAADVAPFQSVVTMDGSAYTGESGSWFADQTSAVQGSTRGWIEYDFSLHTKGVYQVELKVSPRLLGSSSDGIELLVDLDGQRVGRFPVRVVAGTEESAKLLTPWLAAGGHKLRVFVDNAVTSRRMAIQSVTVAAARGSDANGNGVPDWVDLRLVNGNTVESPSESPVSPVCIGGKARWSGLAAVNGAAVKPAPGKCWYADIPLDTDQPTALDVSLENQGVEVNREVAWIMTNLLTAPNLTIRLGDSLKLSAFSGSLPTADESVVLTIEGQTATKPSDQPVVHRFLNAGEIPIHVTHTGNGVTTTATVTVHVVAPPSLSSPICVTGHWREWDVPPLPAGAVLDLEPGLLGETLSLGQAGTRRVVCLDIPDDRPALVRLWNAGPVLSSTTMRGMKVRSGAETSLITLETNAGVSRVAMPVVIDGLWPDADVRIEIFMGGVTFADGSLVRSLAPPQDCDPFGTAMVEFLKTGNIGSTCHRISVWQGGKRIAWKQ